MEGDKQFRDGCSPLNVFRQAEEDNRMESKLYNVTPSIEVSPSVKLNKHFTFV